MFSKNNHVNGVIEIKNILFLELQELVDLLKTVR